MLKKTTPKQVVKCKEWLVASKAKEALNKEKKSTDDNSRERESHSSNINYNNRENKSKYSRQKAADHPQQQHNNWKK